MINATKYNVVIELTNQQLGTVSKSKEIYTKFIASKGVANGKVSEEEVAMEASNIQEDLENSGWTCFMEDEKGLFIYSYMILGFLKDAGFTIKEQLEAEPVKGKAKAEGNLKQIKSKLENSVFIKTRKVYFERNGVKLTKPDGVLERPLRAMTAQGPRIALAKSDYINEGTRLSFELTLLEGKEITIDHVKKIFEMGELRGLGQFRNGSYGTFEVISFDLI